MTKKLLLLLCLTISAFITASAYIEEVSAGDILSEAVGHATTFEEWEDSPNIAPDPDLNIQMLEGNKLRVNAWAGVEGYDIIVAYDDDWYITAIANVINGVEGETYNEEWAYLYTGNGSEYFAACIGPRYGVIIVYDTGSGFVFLQGYINNNPDDYRYYYMEWPLTADEILEVIEAAYNKDINQIHEWTDYVLGVMDEYPYFAETETGSDDLSAIMIAIDSNYQAVDSALGAAHTSWGYTSPLTDSVRAEVNDLIQKANTDLEQLQYPELGLEYEFTDDSHTAYVVTGFTDELPAVVTVPPMHNGLPVVAVGDMAFLECSELTAITLPESITYIGDGAFAECSALTSINLPEALTYIGELAFYECSALSSISIPESISDIGYGTFAYCTSLTTLSLPASIKHIDEGAFEGCTGLETVYVYTVDIRMGTDVFSGINSACTLYVPKGSKAFYAAADQWKDFANIEEFVFYTEVGLEYEFTDDSHTAYKVSGYTDQLPNYVSIPPTYNGLPVVEVGDEAFRDCKTIAVVVVPESITSIGYGAFSGCTNIRAFYGKYSTPDNRCLIVDGVLKAFAPYGITDYIIPESITSIDQVAFSGCSSLTTITLPESITSIGYEAFSGCSNLTSVFTDITDPRKISLDSYVFDNINSECTLYVPIGSVDLYASADQWKDFGSIKERTSSPIFYINDDQTTMSLICSAADAKIYYTLDGTMPSDDSTPYTEPLDINDNSSKIRAIAYGEYPNRSLAVSFNRGDYVLATPKITVDGNNVTITSADGSTVHYTVDGTEPSRDSAVYASPFAVDHNCTIKAFAVKEGMFDSAVDSLVIDLFAAPAPEFAVNADQTLSMSCANDIAKIYYTLDGSEPSDRSALYTQPIKPSKADTVKAIAYAENFNPSEVVSFVVADYTLPQPVITVNGNNVTITAKEGTNVYYTKDGTEPSRDSATYTSAFAVDHNCTIKAFAVKEGMFDSEVATLDIEVFQMPMPTLSYDGRWLSLEAQDNATIYYTLDGELPTTESAVYTVPVDAEGLAMLRAIAVKDGFNDSEELTYEVPAYYNGEVATIGLADSLSVAFGWIDHAEIVNLTVRGNLGVSDWKCLRDLPNLQDLDLYDTTSDNSPNYALAGSGIRYVSMPREMAKIGERLFEGCERLCAIKWNADWAFNELVLAGIESPNVLLYVIDEEIVPSTTANVVVNNHAKSITLSDGYPFYCPEAFRADAISYTHSYTQQTPIGGCAGWETLTLPFDVQRISHADRGEIRPFPAATGEYLPFWLYEMADGSFVPTERIMANRPYIVSFPNNDAYADQYILAGDITYEAFHCDVPVTETQVAEGDGVRFVPTLSRVPQSTEVYALNIYDERLAAGSCFIYDYRDVEPFEAYLTSAHGAMHAPMLSVSDLMGGANALPGLPVADALWSVYAQGGVLYISTGVEQTVPLYTVTGVLVRMLHLQPGVNAVTDLPSGFYIVKTNKIAVKR